MAPLLARHLHMLFVARRVRLHVGEIEHHRAHHVLVERLQLALRSDELRQFRLIVGGSGRLPPTPLGIVRLANAFPDMKVR